MVYHNGNDGRVGRPRAGILFWVRSQIHGYVLDYVVASIASFRLGQSFGAREAREETEVDVESTF
jgi:hypothetical protein